MQEARDGSRLVRYRRRWRSLLGNEIRLLDAVGGLEVTRVKRVVLPDREKCG